MKTSNWDRHDTSSRWFRCWNIRLGFCKPSRKSAYLFLLYEPTLVLICTRFWLASDRQSFVGPIGTWCISPLTVVLVLLTWTGREMPADPRPTRKATAMAFKPYWIDLLPKEGFREIIHRKTLKKSPMRGLSELKIPLKAYSASSSRQSRVLDIDWWGTHNVQILLCLYRLIKKGACIFPISLNERAQLHRILPLHMQDS